MNMDLMSAITTGAVDSTGLVFAIGDSGNWFFTPYMRTEPYNRKLSDCKIPGVSVASKKSLLYDVSGLIDLGITPGNYVCVPQYIPDSNRFWIELLPQNM